MIYTECTLRSHDICMINILLMINFNNSQRNDVTENLPEDGLCHAYTSRQMGQAATPDLITFGFLYA